MYSIYFFQGTMFNAGRAPGDLGFDPLNLGADEAALRYIFGLLGLIFFFCFLAETALRSSA